MTTQSFVSNYSLLKSQLVQIHKFMFTKETIIVHLEFSRTLSVIFDNLKQGNFKVEVSGVPKIQKTSGCKDDSD
jgi:hypothetical protein